MALLLTKGELSINESWPSAPSKFSLVVCWHLDFNSQMKIMSLQFPSWQPQFIMFLACLAERTRSLWMVRRWGMGMVDKHLWEYLFGNHLQTGFLEMYGAQALTSKNRKLRFLEIGQEQVDCLWSHSLRIYCHLAWWFWFYDRLLSHSWRGAVFRRTGPLQPRWKKFTDGKILKALENLKAIFCSGSKVMPC